MINVSLRSSVSARVGLCLLYEESDAFEIMAWSFYNFSDHISLGDHDVHNGYFQTNALTLVSFATVFENQEMRFLCNINSMALSARIRNNFVIP